MRISGLDFKNLYSGTGCRLVIYFAGCRWKCENCFNPNQGKNRMGVEIAPPNLAKLIMWAQSYNEQGITFSGGEPLDQWRELLEVLKILKAELGFLDIWVYTKYKYKNIKELPIIEYIDVIVSGKYIPDYKGANSVFTGSLNQEVIDAKTGEVIFKAMGRGDKTKQRKKAFDKQIARDFYVDKLAYKEIAKKYKVNYMRVWNAVNRFTAEEFRECPERECPE